MNARAKVVSAVLLFAVALWVTSRAGAQIPPPADPFQVKAVWKGPLNQKGNYKSIAGLPITLDCKFMVTKREGEAFEAELYEKYGADIEITYILKGKISLVDPADSKKGYNLKELSSVGSRDVKNTTAINPIPYTDTTLKDGILKGKWKYPANPDGTTLEGDFEFKP